MLLSKKLLLQKFNPLMFLYPHNNGIRIGAVKDFYVTRDGRDIRAASFPASMKWCAPVYGNNRYLTIALSTASDPIVAATSLDGIHWTQVGTIPSGRNLLYAPLVFGDGYFYVATYTFSSGQMTGTQVYRSETGAVWTRVCDIPAPSQYFGNYGFLTYGDGTFVLAGEGSSPQNVIALYSTDGCATWTTSSGPSYPASWTSSHVSFLTWVNGYFVLGIWANGRTSGSLMGNPRADTYRSADGINWTSEWSGTQAPSTLVSNGKIAYTTGYTTTDGQTYTSVNAGGTPTGYTGLAMNYKYACSNGYDQTNNILTFYRYSLLNGSYMVTQVPMSGPHSLVNPSCGIAR